MKVTKLTSAIKEYKKFANAAIWNADSFANGGNSLADKITELSEKYDISDFVIHAALDTLATRSLDRYIEDMEAKKVVDNNSKI